jgi:hypothetical protein
LGNIILQANGFGIEIRKEKNLHMDGIYIVMEFEDGYQHSLVESYHWSEEQAEHEVDMVIKKKLREQGLDCSVLWEDREVFLIEKPTFSAQDVAKVFKSLFKDAEIFEERTTGLFSKVSKMLGFKK